MDKQKQSNSINSQSLIDITSHPAYLWIGSEATIIEKTEHALQQVFCAKNSCKSCVSCKQIIDRQHSSLVWLCPEKNYTIDQLDPIFNMILFSLEKNGHFFFVLQKADFFNQTCANALLKILEEPPPGYHFILLAQRSEYILPTIRSRCLIRQFQSFDQQQEVHQLVAWFKQMNPPDPATFSQKIDKANLSERESLELLDELLEYWSKQYATSESHEKKYIHAQRMIIILKHALEKPPMPGSSKIFWKNFYLQVAIQNSSSQC